MDNVRVWRGKSGFNTFLELHKRFFGQTEPTLLNWNFDDFKNKTKFHKLFKPYKGRKNELNVKNNMNINILNQRNHFR